MKQPSGDNVDDVYGPYVFSIQGSIATTNWMALGTPSDDNSYYYGMGTIRTWTFYGRELGSIRSFTVAEMRALNTHAPVANVYPSGFPISTVSITDITSATEYNFGTFLQPVDFDKWTCNSTLCYVGTPIVRPASTPDTTVDPYSAANIANIITSGNTVNSLKGLKWAVEKVKPSTKPTIVTPTVKKSKRWGKRAVVDDEEFGNSTTVLRKRATCGRCPVGQCCSKCECENEF